ncbi:asparagine synthase (glutamine-hydrolyzing) [Peribacillus muralis]|uniref:asparagine synthase (glutamine-hydrolyzing) n=1 Tax=Peribacillus muralis TaxID=264697 RepID=UPI001F4E5E88|nr:asparagine synthase (glutamine-hydrolyzing) [Peribacillus muralis]MCK1992367.1 asparagine synthase (glutamine-hydrolyzing) [Peribacillus muralis]MCK2012923.1 asparagine synthase (glutamine-hydrolyzing) [Peribacillus muralis]
MCGFVGCIHEYPKAINSNMKDSIKKMNTIITHRGPDDEGYYFDDFVNFGFRRLSIIDIDNGNQPLSYENERYWIIFNGEIYNHIELRKELIDNGYEFTTHSDTEVILALYSSEEEQTVQKLRGMFAFVIWDKIEKKLFGARDHFGIKPFFYCEQDDVTYFASEKKSILTTMNEELDVNSLQHYLSFQYVPEPSTLSKNIQKLLPGHYFTKEPGKKMNITKFWKPTFQPSNIEDSTIIKEIQETLIDSVNVHMRSDVPVGSFLSGGIDSSFICSIAKQINPKIKTFSVGFGRDGYSEIDVAQETAEALNLENISYIISPEEFLAELPKIIWHMDDPLADPAAVPLYFVAREAKKHVKVALSGEGADELFGGYNIYREPHSLRMFSYMPAPVNNVLKTLSSVLPEGVKGKSFIERGVTALEDRYIGNANIFDEKEKKIILVNYLNGLDNKKVTSPIYSSSIDYDPITQMQNIDIQTWLKGDILLKADKMSMANSLEVRVPFLDKCVFNTAAKLSMDQKVRNGTTKYMLRKAARGIVPEHVWSRKKLGFPVPIRHWLKDELYDWAVRLIHDSQTDYLFNKQQIMELLENHVNNKRDNSRKIWTILTFMIWHQIYVENQVEHQPEKVLHYAFN